MIRFQTLSVKKEKKLKEKKQKNANKEQLFTKQVYKFIAEKNIFKVNIGSFLRISSFVFVADARTKFHILPEFYHKWIHCVEAVFRIIDKHLRRRKKNSERNVPLQ